METYWSLTEEEQAAIEEALDTLELELGSKLANDDRAAKAAEALAVYVLSSRTIN